MRALLPTKAREAELYRQFPDGSDLIKQQSKDFLIIIRLQQFMQCQQSELKAIISTTMK